MELRHRSKALLGNRYRLEIAASIFGWSGDPLTTQALADVTGLPYPRVHEELGRLVAAGVLTRSSTPAADGSIEYSQVSTVYWELCASLFNELGGESGAKR